MIYAEPEDFRGRSFRGLLAYLLHDAGLADSAERVAFAMPVRLMTRSAENADDEMKATAMQSLLGRKRGQRPDRFVFHFILSWHPDDNPTDGHKIDTALSALEALGLGEHQAVIVGHTDTQKPHVHVVANVIHPVTGKAAKLGWRHRTMSRWAARYEVTHGVIRCKKRFIPKAANESRKRIGWAEWETRPKAPNKRKASHQPAPRP